MSTLSDFERADYWFESAEYDLQTACAMLETRRLLYVGFMCHQAVEKALDNDIDIAVVMDEVPDDYLSTMALPWKLTRSVDHEIEPVLLTSADDASGFLRTVQRTGIAI